MEINDGTGKGYKAGVNNENRLLVNGVIEDIQYHTNKLEGDDYSIIVDTITDGTDNHFLYIKNNDAKNLIITSINYFAADDTELYILTNVTGTPTNASDETVTNRNVGSGNTPDADIKGGVNLQLENGGELERIKILAADGSKKLEWESTLIIPKNRTLVFASSAETTINCTINIFFHD